jgi:plastocyanin
MILPLLACSINFAAAPAPTQPTGITISVTETAAATLVATATPAARSAATISLSVISFSGATNVTIKTGQAVLFDDPASSGGTHDLVIGHNGQFSAMSGAPSELNSATGMLISPGQRQIITFATAGTYPITCTIHPSMQATVTVTA